MLDSGTLNSGYVRILRRCTVGLYGYRQSRKMPLIPRHYSKSWRGLLSSKIGRRALPLESAQERGERLFPAGIVDGTASHVPVRPRGPGHSVGHLCATGGWCEPSPHPSSCRGHWGIMSNGWPLNRRRVCCLGEGVDCAPPRLSRPRRGGMSESCLELP